MIVEASRTINLGKQGDNDYTVVKFDVSGWSAYGDGIFSLNHKRSIDCSAYPCVVSYENGFVYWTIKATDTQFAGNGLAQLVYSNEDGVIIHTEIYNTFVAKSLVTTDTPPEPFRPWVDRITGMIETETAQRMADDEELANAIDEEAGTRAANDTTLNNKIEAEAQQRAEEDAELWEAIETAGSVQDVQINGTSILVDGVANITGQRVEDALGYEPAKNSEFDEAKRKLDALWDLNNGISYKFETDSSAGNKVVPSGAKTASVDMIGGQTIKGSEELISAAVDSVVVSGASIVINEIPDAVKALEGYGWGIGDVANTIERDEDGKWWYVKRINSVDLESLSWQSAWTNAFYNDSLSDALSSRDFSIPAILKHFKYTAGSPISGTPDTINIWEGTGAAYNRTAVCTGSSETPNGVLLYQLREPIRTDITNLMQNVLDPFTCEAGGEINFRYPQDDLYEIDVPNSVEYFVALNEV